MKSIKGIVYIIILLVLIGSVTYYISFGTPWSMMKHKNTFETFLENKYKKDFIISEISYDISHNTYHAYAYDVDNADLTFYVGENSSNKEIDDGYDFELTLAKAKIDVEKIVEDNLSEYTKVSVELISLSDKELEINVRSKKQIDNNIEKLIKEKVKEKGYKVEQVYFHIDE